jgi:sugar phosphate isomerase/epimerase
MNLTLAHLTISATPMETIDAAAVAGFDAVGLRICPRRPGDPFPVDVVGVTSAARQLRARANDVGVRLSNVSAYQFYPDVEWRHVAPVIDTTAELGIPVVVANGFDGDLSRFADLFARYCDAAAAAGIRVALEFLPYSAVRTLDQAVAIVRRSGAANAGILLDALHLDRSGAGPSAIKTIDAGRIVFAQLCDAKKCASPKNDDELLKEARSARLPAGEGELPLYEFLDALPEGLEIEYEVARLDMAGSTPAQKALQARADAERFMAGYALHRQRIE